MANDLESLSSDLIDLIDGKSVYARRYDHETGRMSKPLPVPSNDIIIVSGLHTLYLPTLRECCDLSIYLDIDESLRRYFKIQRDMGQRGHSLEKILEDLEKRSIDAEHFIHPQAAYADLVLSLQPVDPEMLRTIPTASDVRLKLAVRSRRILYEQTLHRELVGFCGFQLDVTSQRGAEEIVLMIEGDCPADDIAQAARIVCPDMMDFMDANPLWQGGIEGAMQLVVLAHINQSFNKRLL